MKSKLKMQTPASTLFALIVTLTVVTAVVAPAADKKSIVNPTTGLPARPDIDPSTGLPIPTPAAEWKDPNWKDPEKVLPAVTYDGWPLGEVALDLRKQFTEAFDVLIPNGWKDPGDQSRSIDPPQDVVVKIQLKNVTASEVFNAMNLVFETANTPVRWQLKMNGNRPTAVLHVLPALVHTPPASPPSEVPKRMIYFVGDLIGEKSGMAMEQLVNTVSEVYQMSYGMSLRGDGGTGGGGIGANLSVANRYRSS